MGLNRYLVFNAFICGAVIMVVELLGSRIIGPPFGVSLFVWTSLITVTLVSLALGYWLGGRLADRKNSHSSLFGVILIAGLWVALIPLVKGFVIEQTLVLGLRAGSLACSAALFGPPLFLLGMVSPYTVKLYMSEDSREVGRTVGWLYAVSTGGSFLGTVLTGFILIPMLGVNNITYLSALTLIAISAGYWVLFRKKALAAALAIVPIALLFTPQDLPSITRPDGTKVTVLVNDDSAYGQIKVVDYEYDGARLREFLLENMIQGAVDLTSGVPISRYTYYVEQLSYAYSPEAKEALVIGLGSGIIPERFSRYGIRTDVVEINPGVVEAAKTYFSFDPAKHPTFVEDGRNFLKSGAGPYDIIFLDAFSGDTPPSHLMSVEAFSLARGKLSPGGTLIINFVSGNQIEDQKVPSSLFGTLKKVFQSVDVYAGPDFFAQDPRVVNMVFVARDGVRPIETGFVPADAPVEFIDDLKGLYLRKVSFKPGPFVFTDDYNPIDFYDSAARERFRAHIISNTDREIITE
ncbi:MAG: fused MFS/spermidine synthase [Deltaproteobacteria bacterium]|nr:fused MFS/spermidine synthase [Deltaproteobacteria bacterium]